MYLRELMKIVLVYRVKMQEKQAVVKVVLYKHNVLVEKPNKKWKKNRNKFQTKCQI